MRIGILGGSFDPPHFGHLRVARQLLINHVVDEVWLVPCFSHAFEKKMSPAAKRYEMTKLLESDGIKVSDYEIKRKTTGYTIDTMNFFTKTYKEHKFFWILGSDQLFVFEKYKNWKEIIKKHNLIVYPREKDFEKICNFIDELVLKVGTSENIIVLSPKEFMAFDVSSTKVREKVGKGDNVTKLIPKEIEEYIKKNKLYI